jgi:hypothetical protein
MVNQITFDPFYLFFNLLAMLLVIFSKDSFKGMVKVHFSGYSRL